MSRPSAFSGPSSIQAHEIQLVERIGVGCFGTVYRGICRTQEVAVKVPKKQKLTRKAYDAFRREVDIMSKIYHPNVCLFMGACLIPGNIRIVTELMAGDLETLIKSDAELLLSSRMKFAKDAAKGMAWLHGNNPPVIHRDLKVANMLYDENMRIKVCDFGLSEFQIDEEIFEKEPKGTPLYMAPEVMLKEAITPKVDVYSFGVILWELVTRKEAYAHHNSYDVFMNAVCNGERPEIPADTPKKLKALMEVCWQNDAEARPEFSEIVTPLLDDVIAECETVECMQRVDANITNLDARAFWKNHFLDQTDVPIDEFISSLYSFFEMNIPEDPSKRPLPEDPTEDEIRTASNFQLNELESRSPAMSRVVAAERARRSEAKDSSSATGYMTNLYGYGYDSPMNPVTIDEGTRAVMCLKALFGGEDEKVNITQFGIVIGAFAPFTGDIIDRIVVMMQEPWFHGFLKPREVEHLLKNKDRGTYLVRFSNRTSHANSFVISKVSSKKVIKHVVVPYKEEKGYKLETYFSSLGDLISEHSASLHLTYPCPGSKYGYLFGDVSNEMGGYMFD